MNRTRKLPLALALAAALATAAPAAAETTTIDHLPVADEYGDVGSISGTLPTWGQVITVPDSPGRWDLTAASLIFLARDGLAVRFEVRRWGGDRSVGPALWRSERLTPDESLLYHRIDLDPTGVVVDGGEQIVLTATLLGEDMPPAAAGNFGAWLADPYAGGGLWASFATSLDELDDAPWQRPWPNIDLTFAATFEPVQEPEPEPGPQPQPQPHVPPPAADPTSVEPAPQAAPAPIAGAPPIAVTVPSGAPAAGGSSGGASVQACRVPQLEGATRKQARRRLGRAGCRLGRVRGPGRLVRRQSRPAGSTLPAGTRVSVTTRR